jgi:hypothetical protein
VDLGRGDAQTEGLTLARPPPGGGRSRLPLAGRAAARARRSRWSQTGARRAAYRLLTFVTGKGSTYRLLRKGLLQEKAKALSVALRLPPLRLPDSSVLSHRNRPAPISLAWLASCSQARRLLCDEVMSSHGCVGASPVPYGLGLQFRSVVLVSKGPCPRFAAGRTNPFPSVRARALPSVLPFGDASGLAPESLDSLKAAEPPLRVDALVCLQGAKCLQWFAGGVSRGVR